MKRKRVLAFSNSIFSLSFLVWVAMLCLPEKAFGQTQTFTSSGTFTVPHKITTLQVDLWAGGGGGGFNSNNQRPAAGGGGGGFTRSSGFAVTPSSSISVTIGTGGTGGANAVTSTVGGNTTFGTITANGGGRGNGTTGGIGGGGSGGSYFFKGGDSPNSGGSNNNGGNGGGAAGNSVAVGANGSTNSGSTGGAGGIGANGGGNGGSGGNNDFSGNSGVIPGGGGGGEGRDGAQGGSGARGEVQVSWTCSNTLTSGAGTNNQTVCLGTGIGNITYVLAGATGATIAGLPAGVTGTYNVGDITISGIPSASGIFNYTITPTGSCTSSTATGTITVSAPPAISAQSTAAQTVCIGIAFSPISVTASGTGINYQWFSNPTASTSGGIAVGTNSNTYTPSSAALGTLYYYVVVTGACSPTATSAISGAFIVNPNNTVTPASSSPSLCIDTPLPTITHTTTNATSIGTATGLPSGVTASFASNTITISGTPTASGTFNYSIPLNGCGNVNATGTITVTPNNTAGTISSNTFCSSSALSGITQSTTGAMGIGAASNLPPGVTVAWATNTITFSGIPTTPGTYTYSIPLTGGCGAINATGTITINGLPTITSQSTAAQTRCIGVAFSSISVTATGTGLSYQWYANTTPSNSGGTLVTGATSSSYTPSASTAGTTYYYSVVSGTCSPVATSAVSGAFLVNHNNTVSAASATPTVCIGVAMPIPVTHTTTGATGIGVETGLPTGITASFGSNTITILGTPTVSGVFNYTIPLTGGCGSFTATGTITVNATAAIITPSLAAQSSCINTTAFNPLSVATGTGFNYQWYSNTVNSNSGGTLIGGAITESYLPPNNVAGTTYYYVVVSSQTACGVAVTSGASGAIIVYPLPVVSFTTQPSGTQCVDTDLTYTTQTGQSSYVWAIPGILGTDYTITSGGNGSANLVLKWLTPGSKSVTVDYKDAQGCGATSPATSNTITVQKNTVTAPSTYPSACLNATITPFTHTTTLATGIGTATGLPTGLTAAFGSNTITISGTIAGSVTPGFYNYSIPLTGGCGAVAATGTVEVTPVYTLITTTSVSPSATGGTATITITGNPLELLDGTYQVTYSMGLSNTSGPTTTTVTILNGRGVFSTTAIGNEDLTSLTISQIKKVTDACFIPLSANNTTFFGIRSAVYTANGTFYVPSGIYQITIKVWGGGGGGGNGTQAGGGGGGGYSIQTISVTPGEPIGIYIGQGGTSGSNGGNSYASRDPLFPNSLVYANGGSGGTATAGGAGGLLVPGSSNAAGIAGGKRSGYGGAGGNGGGSNGGTGAPEHNDGKAGVAGNTPGGGGSGGNGNGGSGNGGAGGKGLILISYPLPPVGPCFKVIDDGAISGTTIIEFTCDYTWTAPEGLMSFSVVVGSAGGGGGSGEGSGGGGSGSLITQTYTTTNPYGLPADSNFGIAIGLGGLGAIGVDVSGQNGLPTSFSGPVGNPQINISVPGGGGGGSRTANTGGSGSSGGGGGASPSPDKTVGSGGNSNPITYTGSGAVVYQGNPGGNGDYSEPQNSVAGGGGGGLIPWKLPPADDGQHGKAAGNGQGEGGRGGDGIIIYLEDSIRYFGAGGGGVGRYFNGTDKSGGGGSAGGIKIGGDGNLNGASPVGFPGIDKTGSGGGAGYNGGGRGGNGIVYIYYDNFRILPVEFLYFNALYFESNRSSSLSWATAQEWENSHFEIERSVNGVSSWSKIGEMEGQGYSEIPTEYSFTDAKLPAAGGVVYYRLKQVDFDGKFTYSATKSIKVDGIKGNGAWIAYPNPSSNKNTVTVDLLNRSVFKDEPILIQISDVRGVFKTFTVNQIESVSEVVNSYLDQSTQGIYILQLIWGNNAQQLKLLRE